MDATATEVRWTLNGKEIGIKPIKAYKAIFHTKYAPGTLRAEALDEQGTVLSVSELKTGGMETILSVKPEKMLVRPGEVFYVPIEFTDQNGVLKPYIEQRAEIVTDNAELLGFGSALTKTDEVFDMPNHNTYRGRALAVFRANKEGTITIKADSKGYPSATATVEIQA